MLNTCNLIYISIQIIHSKSDFLQNLEKDIFVMTFSYICAMSDYKGTFHWCHTGKTTTTTKNNNKETRKCEKKVRM